MKTSENNAGWGQENNGKSNMGGSNNNGTGPSDFSDLIGILTGQSLMGSNNDILELKDIRKNLTETLDAQRATATVGSVSAVIPKVLDMSPEQSPHLPGIILFTVINSEVYLMPCLFYKKDVASDSLEVINFGGNVPSQTYQKFAEAFMTDELRANVIKAFTTVSGKQMTRQYVVANKVTDVDMFMQSNKDSEQGIDAIAKDILSEWYNAINNFAMMSVAAKNAGQMPNIFRGGKLLGDDDTAVARIDTVQHPFTLDGRPVPYNLQVKLATAPKGNIFSNNFNNTRTIGTTFMNVSLEVMSTDLYRQAQMRQPSGMGIGPLIPVISLGKTVLGEQLNNNQSVIADLLGIYNQLGANGQIFFSEAFRQANVGARGSLANLAKIAYQVSGRPPANNEQILTTKSLSNPQLVMNFIQNYVSQKAIFVMDIPKYTERPANAEFWWNLLTHKNGTDSTYYKAFLMLLDKLTNGQFSTRSNEAIKNNNDKVWRPGDDIMIQTPVIVPVGTARGKDGLFSLEEVDQMLLRDPLRYGDDDRAVGQYMTLVNGNSGKELRVRQYEIKKTLEFLFSGNVSLTGWKSRWRFSDKFLNSFAAAMVGAGNVTVTSNSATHIWETQVSADYLLNTSTAGIHSNYGGVASSGGNVYTGWQ